MKTPVCDFAAQYAASGALRLHMPGHKGAKVLGPEALDITEIDGADVLYQARGILRESEENAARLFGAARTVYSAEGSSLCIRAMLWLAQAWAKLNKRPCRIAAARNAHRVFLEAAALLDLEPVWFAAGGSLLESRPDLAELEGVLRRERPTAVYLTSPDYLGTCVELSAAAALCHQHGALLLVDNAHGAYLRFLDGGRHPMDCGCDLCCDSAHKTLPVLTGGAYLHFGRSCPAALLPMAEQAMALFASTSPSYLILQSLDAANALLDGEYPKKLRRCADRLDALKARLQGLGYALAGDEPLKLTLRPKSRGYTGSALAEILQEKGIVCEFSDPDYLVLMFSPLLPEEAFARVEAALSALPARAPISEQPPAPVVSEAVLSPRQALLSPFETVPVEKSLGRILAAPGVGCPPAVPILLCGERIGKDALRLFRYYGIEELPVVLQ